MKSIAVLLVVLALASGCATPIESKLDSDGYYQMKSEPFRVKAPKLQLQGAVYDRGKSVDFVMEGGYWTLDGNYAIQVFDIPPGVTDERSYCDATEQYLPRYLENDRSQMGFHFQVQKVGKISVNGRPAYRGIAVDPTAHPLQLSQPAIFVVTSIYFKSKIIMASLLYPMNSRAGKSYEEQVPWPQYNAFVESIAEVP